MIVSVTKNEVKITELSQVNQGDYKVNLCTFVLPECFSGLSVTAVFNGIPVPVAENRCYIPSLEIGNCILGVYAYKEENGKTMLMYSPKPTVFYVDRGSFTTDVNTEALPKVFDYETYCNMLKDFWEQIVKENALSSNDKKTNLSFNKFPFEVIDLPLTEANYAYVCTEGTYKKKDKAEEGFSPITKCPKYLGFRIDGDETRLYLYIGTMVDGKFELDESYIIDTTESGTINHLRQSHNRFIETDGEKYFYYKVNAGSKDKVTLIGCDEFPEGESDVIATTTTVVKNNGDLRATTSKYYSIVLPSGCFYAVLNKKGMPTFLKPDTEDEETTTVPLFNVSYQTGVTEDEVPVIEVSRGASFGVIPENVGAALLRLPCTYELSDLCIYTDKVVKSNAKSGRRRKANEIGEKIIKDFSFLSQKEIFWNDSVRAMESGRRFYGVPYSSRWVNSHYLGFEVSVETMLNALNDPCSVAYDGGFTEAVYKGNTVVGKKRGISVSGHTEISGKGSTDINELEEPNKNGGTGYGLVCSAFTNLICGNPYPQSNRGYTFDSNYILENTVDMNSGEVLVNKGLSHCVFVDEIYDKGYSLLEAVDPCVAKTTHTCPPEMTSYASSRVRTNTLDEYVYSVTNKDMSGYESLQPLLNLENITIANGKVRPWRGNKAVYGSWDITPKVNGRDFGGSGIGVTLHDGITSFTLKTPSGKIEIINNVKYPQCFKNESYADISMFITENGTYEISDGTVSEFFRFYNHDTVQLTFDAEGKAVFKTLDGKAADDVEYIYVNVKGYGGAFGKNASLEQEGDGAMVIAKGKCYPDLALDTSRILDVRAAIVSDPAEDCWGKYSCATSPDVVSEYKGVNGGGATAFQTLPMGKNLLNRETDTVGYNLTETGELSANGSYEVTDFIPVVENESYRLSDTGVGKGARTLCFYDINKNVVNFASNLVGTAKIIAPENAKYVRFSFLKSFVNPQFEQREIVTEYEPFVGKEQIGYNELYIPKRAIPSEALKCMTKKAGGKNLLDRTLSEVGKILLATGELSNASTNETSDYIPVAYGDNIVISGIPDGSNKTVLTAYALYDENKNFVSAVVNAGGYGANPLPIPRNIKYVRYSYRKAGTNIQIERGTEATEYEQYIGVPALDDGLIGLRMPNDLPYSLNPWSGKRLVVDGDSITHDQGLYDYWQFVAAKLTDMYVDNSDKTTQYANGWKGVGGSRIANELGANDPKYSIVLRYMNLPDDADLVMIAAGTNDWAHDNVLLGDFDSTDDKTFNGALNILLPALKEKYPTTPVVMMTPIKRGTYGQLNKNGNTQEEFVEALIKKCRQYNVYCLDMWANCPINPNITAMEQLYVKPDGTNDKTHPNTEGHKIMGRTVAGFIRSLN